MRAQQHAGGWWFCALKMQYMAKSHQFVVAISLASEVASLTTLSFNRIVAVKAKRSLKCLHIWSVFLSAAILFRFL